MDTRAADPATAWVDRRLDVLPRRVAHPLRVAWHGAMRWIDGSGPQLGASIAFYTMFALAPWLVITIALAGLVFGAEAARGQIVEQIGGLVGLDAARAIEAMILSAWKKPAGAGTAALAAVTLAIGASGVFAELRRAINAIAGIAPSGNVVTMFVRVRLRAFALLVGFGFFAIASLMLSAAISAIGVWAGARWPVWTVLARLFDSVIATALLAVAFGALLRWLPDRPPRRAGLVISAIVSALLFSIGKHLIGLYLGRASIASSYGAAGSFVVVMLWVYYSSQIMLFGAACGYADETLRQPPSQSPAPAQNLQQIAAPLPPH